MSSVNNTILASIDKYALYNNINCIEGKLNEDGMILGYSGLIVNKGRSYSNMKGVGFKEELIVYDRDKCILNKEDNYDKYIISGNNYKKYVSFVIDIDSKKYYEQYIDIFRIYGINVDLLVNDDSIEYSNLLYKGNNKKVVKKFKKNNNYVYCVKDSDYEIIDMCSKLSVNSIKVINYISKDLFSNTKKILNKGVIIFIKENSINLEELSITLNYVVSRGYSIVNINDLLL